MTSTRYMVAFGPLAWSGSWQRPQQILSLLAGADLRVLYVDYPVKIISPTTWRELINPGSTGLTLTLRTNLSVARPDLFTCVLPTTFLPFDGRWRPINHWNCAHAARFLRRLLPRIGFPEQPDILWVTVPTQVDLIEFFPQARVCYDCMDDHSAWARAQDDPTLLTALESELVARCDLVFASSAKLQDKIQHLGKTAILTRNGVEVSRFQNPEQDESVLDQLKAIPRPIALYVGNVASWLDLETIRQLALADICSVVLVGPVSVSTAQLAGLANVHLLGQRPYCEMSAFMHCADVCLYPFKMCDLTLAVNPVKVYEYIASDRPVVAYTFPELESLREVVHLVDDQAGFVEAVRHVLDHPHLYNSATLTQARAVLAAQHSWQSRANTIKQHLQTVRPTLCSRS